MANIADKSVGIDDKAANIADKSAGIDDKTANIADKSVGIDDKASTSLIKVLESMIKPQHR